MDIASAWLSTFPFESFVQHDKGITAYIPQSETHAILIDDCRAIPFNGVKLSVDVEEIKLQNWKAFSEAQYHKI